MNQLKINAQALSDALSRSPYNSKDAVLKMAMLEIDEDQVIITSMDDAATMVQRVKHEGADLDPVAVDIAILNGVIQSLTGIVTLKYSDSRLILTTGKRRYTIPCIPGGGFPSLPEHNAIAFDVNVNELLRGLRRVNYAAAKDDVRKFFNGICLQPHNLVATDGNRMAVYPFECNMPDEAGIIIPNKSVQHIHKHVIPDCSVHLIYLKNNSNINMLCFKSEHYELYCKLIDLKYPNWKSIATKSNAQTHHIKINKNEMTSILQRMSLYEPLFDIENSKVGISISSKDAKDQLHTKLDSTDDFNVSFSNRNFSDVLSLCDEKDEIVFHGSKSDEAWMIKINDKFETHYMMPFRR